MSKSYEIIALLDANVLYPAPLRDFLLNLADTEIYKPIWNDKIQEEWKNNLLKNRSDLSSRKLERTIQLMNKAFPSASTKINLEILEKIKLPDQDDKHVLSSAIISKLDYIVTWNIKDFPQEILNQFQIQAIKPDQFITKLHAVDPNKIKIAFNNQLSSLKNPKFTKDELVRILKKNGLKNINELL